MQVGNKVDYNDYKGFLGPIRPCLICGNDHNGEKRINWAIDVYFQALKCDDCGMITVDPCLTPAGLNKYYGDVSKKRLADQKKTEYRERQYVIDKKFLEMITSNGRVLDVGCHGGHFLNILSDDFEKYGIDINKDAVEYANDQFSFDVKNEDIVTNSFKNNFFDIIVYRGVIEHLYDPKNAFEISYELLKEKGKIFVAATPNVDSFCAEMYREKWNLWHPIEHINLFSIKTIHSIIGKDRYKIIDIDYPYIGTPYENRVSDYNTILNDIYNLKSGRKDQVSTSPPFWGNMLSVIFEKF